jgi:hypothetical protein
MRRLLVLLMLICMPTWAKTHAPLPDAVYSAKTVYVLNKTGIQDVADTAYGQLQKWGRFSVTTNKDSADLILEFSHESGLTEGTTIGFTQMLVFARGSDEPAFQTTERYRSKLFGSSSTKACIESFKKRLESK